MGDDDEPGPDEVGLGLDEVLAALRHDLLAARRDSTGGNTGLGVQQVVIELTAEVSRRTDAQGEVSAKWFVLSGSASGGHQRERNRGQKITLTLGPVGEGTGEGAGGGTGAGTGGGSGTAPSELSPGVLQEPVAGQP